MKALVMLPVTGGTVGTAAVELLALARDRRVKRVVTLSAMNADDDLADQWSRYGGDRDKEVEDAAVLSGLEWVSLRAGFFAVNTTVAWGAQIRAGDVVRGPYAASTEARIHEQDPAGVAPAEWVATMPPPSGLTRSAGSNR